MLKQTSFVAIVLGASVMFPQAASWSSDDNDFKSMPKKGVLAFTKAKIFVEQNFSDGDTEVVLEAKGGDIGLRKLWILAPDGKVVYQFKAPADGRNIGGREIVVESPEPADVNKILAAYPKGQYTFIGRAFDGQWLMSKTELSHTIPIAASITFPTAGTTVSRHSLAITWEPVTEATSYSVELKNRETTHTLKAVIPGNQNSFHAPAEWLSPGTGYQVSIFVINAAGNKTSSEIDFTTLQD